MTVGLLDYTILRRKTFELTAWFETSRTSPDCFGIVANNWDGQGISYGAMQWNLGQGTLQGMLQYIHDNNPTAIQQIWGDNYSEFTDLLAMPTVADQVAWGASISEASPSHSLKQPYQDYFLDMGYLPETQYWQINVGTKWYFDNAEKWKKDLGLWSRRGYALLYDISIQAGSFPQEVIDDCLAEFKKIDVWNKSRQAIEAEKLKIVAEKRIAYNDIYGSEASKSPFRQRKTAIANGDGYVYGSYFNTETYDALLEPAFETDVVNNKQLNDVKPLKIDVFQLNSTATDLEWMGMIEEVEKLVLRSHWNKIVNSTLSIRKGVLGASLLQRGRFVIINGDVQNVCIVEEMEQTLADPTMTYTLVPMKGILNNRVTWNDATHVYSWRGKTQSQIMMQLMWYQGGQGTVDVNRKFKPFGVTGLKYLGDIIDYDCKWDDIKPLGDEMVMLANASQASSYPIGWNIWWNDYSKQFIFDCYEGADRTINQDKLNPVVFSDQFGNIQNASYVESDKEFKDYAYVYWKGEVPEGSPEGTQPIEYVTPVTNMDYVPTNFDRREMFVKSDQKTSLAIKPEAKSLLNKRPRVQSFTAEVMDSAEAMATYRVNYFLGDIVTVQSKDIVTSTGEEVSIDTQITQVEETYEKGQYMINLTFGDGRLSFVDIIKNAVGVKK